MPPITLKVTSNTPFHKIDSVNELRETWKVCTKVKDSLENGSRLENLSWRLWFVHNNSNSDIQTITTTTNHKNERNQVVESNNKLDEMIILQDDETQQQLQPPNPSPPLEPPPPPPEQLTTAIQQQIEYRRMLRRQQHEQFRQKITEQDYDQSCDEQQQPQEKGYPVQEADKSTYHHSHSTITTTLPNMVWQQQRPDATTSSFNPTILSSTINQPTTSTMINYYGTNGENEPGTRVVGTTPVQPVPNSPALYTSTIQPPPTSATVITQQSIQDGDFNNVSNATINPIAASTPSASCEQAFNTSSWDILADNDPSATGTGFYVPGAIPSPVPNGNLYSKLLSTLPRETLESVEKLLMPQTYPLQDQVPGSMMTSFPQEHILQNDVDGSSLSAVDPHPSFNLSLSTTATSQQQQQQQQQPSPIIITTNNASFSSLGYGSSSAPSSPIRKSSNKYTKTKNPVKKKINNHVYISTLHFPSTTPSHPEQKNQYSSEYRCHQHKSIINTTSTTTVRRSLPVKSSSLSDQGQSPVCSNCSTTQTPLWRRSSDDELLCNACGLYLKLHNAPRPKYLKPHSGRKDGRGEHGNEDGFQQPICSNCATSMTPLWRRDNHGQPLCNACGLYLKLHNQRRPLSLKSDTIKKRQRVENSEMVTPTATAASTTRRPAKKNKQ